MWGGGWADALSKASELGATLGAELGAKLQEVAAEVTHDLQQFEQGAIYDAEKEAAAGEAARLSTAATSFSGGRRVAARSPLITAAGRLLNVMKHAAVLPRRTTPSSRSVQRRAGAPRQRPYRGSTGEGGFGERSARCRAPPGSAAAEWGTRGQ